MSTPKDKPVGRRVILTAIRDIVIAVAFGLAAEGIAIFFLSQVSPEAQQELWFNDFQILVKMVTGATVGGIAYAMVLHIHHKNESKIDETRNIGSSANIMS